MKSIKMMLERLSFKFNAKNQQKRYYPNIDEDFFKQIREAAAEINNKGEI